MANDTPYSSVRKGSGGRLRFGAGKGYEFTTCSPNIFDLLHLNINNFICTEKARTRPIAIRDTLAKSNSAARYSFYHEQHHKLLLLSLFDHRKGLVTTRRNNDHGRRWPIAVPWQEVVMA